MPVPEDHALSSFSQWQQQHQQHPGFLPSYDNHHAFLHPSHDHLSSGALIHASPMAHDHQAKPFLPDRQNGNNNSNMGSTFPTAPAALSANAAVGVGAKKVSKRRSRAINKPPITVLSADTTTFRDMVQKLTGIPASPSLQNNSFHLWNSPPAGFASFLKPHLTRPSQSNIQGLPTLDTSSAFLLLNGAGSALNQTSRMLPSENFPQGFPSLNPFLHSSHPDSAAGASFNADSLISEQLALNRAQLASGTNIDLKSLFANHLDHLKQDKPDQNSSTAPSLGDPTERIFTERLREILANSPMDNMAMQSTQGTESSLSGKQTRNLDNLLAGNNKLDMEFPGRTQHALDSWLSCDGIHATPKMELAHSA